ncbi:hypothetical protein FRC01_001363 [Tulasnella sp. 417]|nr:hypothetical protein FRC01_001363 [Tulasnella sp. 417]
MSTRTILPKFTLFVGKQCSLCVTAKEALEVVRQKRPFELETINIYDEGREKWRGKYKYEIPVLHLNDKMQAKGRWGEPEILKALEWDELGYIGVFFDTEGFNATDTNAHILYNRLDEVEPLGFSSPRGEDITSSRDHVLSSCPEPRDSQRIAAARAAYQESRGDHSLGGDDGEHPDFGRRYYSVPLWREQRLEWVNQFQPGRIIGADLREAVGLPRDVPPGPDSEIQNSVPWLDGGDAEGSCGGMMFWGYPPGWVGPYDPRDLMRRRIVRASAWENADDNPITFTIYETDSEDQVVELAAPQSRPPTPTSIHDFNHRWAHYQTTLFSSDKLTISNVDCPLPPVPRRSDAPTPANPPTVDRKALWARLVASQNGIQPTPIPQPLLPWRVPGALNWGPPY